MGNCLRCWKSSEDQEICNSTTPAAVTGADPTTVIGNLQSKVQILSKNLDYQNQKRSSGNDRNLYYNRRPDETDELLSSSPLNLKNTNVCSMIVAGSTTAVSTSDTKRSSFKKPSLVLLNGNSNNMGDIITTVKEPLQVSDNTLNLLFEKYKDPNEDAILSEGIERLCKDLGYQPDDFAILVLAWRLAASQMCYFTKLEFIQGLQTMMADSIDLIRLRLEQTIEKLKTDAEMFKQLYRFTFRFGLEPDHRILTLDMAIILWRLVFTVYTPEILNCWLYFLEQHPNIRGIPKDTWNMFLNFAETCDITQYDDTEAWPSLFDDFVDYEKSRVNNINNANNGFDSTTNSDGTITTNLNNNITTKESIDNKNYDIL